MEFLPLLTEESWFYSSIGFEIPKPIKFRFLKILQIEVAIYIKMTV